MSADLKKGDHVNWSSAQGTIEGTVVRKATSDTQIKSHHVNASEEDPQFIVKSDATGALAAHKPEALHKDGASSASQKGKSSPKSSPKVSKKKDDQEDKASQEDQKETKEKTKPKESKKSKESNETNETKESSEGVSNRTRSHDSSEKQKGEPAQKKSKKEETTEEKEDESKKRKDSPKKKSPQSKKSKSESNSEEKEEKKAEKNEEKVEKETPKKSNEASDDEGGDKDQLIKDFNNLVNMSAKEIESWLETKDSKETGMTREGETEAVGHQSGRKIIKMLGKKPEDWTEDELQHARKVRSYIKRHSAQKPEKDDLAHTKWTYSLKNWGHDPMKH